MTEEPTQAEELARDCFAWANGDASKAEAMADTLDVYNPGLPGGEVHSREEWAQYRDQIEAGFPDVHFGIDALVAEDDIAMVEFRITGTHEREFQGLPPTGREMEILGVDVLDIEDGKVTEWRTYYDREDLKAQMGLTFPEIIGQMPKLLWAKIT